MTHEKSGVFATIVKCVSYSPAHNISVHICICACQCVCLLYQELLISYLGGELVKMYGDQGGEGKFLKLSEYGYKINIKQNRFISSLYVQF